MLFPTLLCYVLSFLDYNIIGTSITITGDASVSKEFYQNTGNFKEYTEIVLGEGITGLGNEAFVSSSLLQKVFLSSTIQSIHFYSFRFCYKIQEIRIAENSTYFKNDPNGLLLTKDGLTLIKAPCVGLSKLEIPPTVQTLEALCLHGIKLSSVNIPWHVKKFGVGVFIDSQIVSISFDDNSTITSLGNSFLSYSPIRSIRIPKSVESISGSFYLSSVTSVTFQEGSKLKRLEGECFGEAPLPSLELPEGLEVMGDLSISNVAALKTISIPSTVNYISSSAFDRTTNLERIVCNNNPFYKSVDDMALYSANMSMLLTTSVLVEEIVIGESMALVGRTLLQGCSKLVSLNVSEDNEAYSGLEGVLYNKKKTAALAVIGGISRASFASTCTKIDEQCCYGCALLESVFIPESVQVLSKFCFSQSGLKSVSLSPSVSEFGDSCFEKCANLGTIDFNGSKITTVPLYCFYQSGLTSIAIPPTVTYFANYCFKECKSLKSVAFASNSNPVSFGYSCFKNCIELVSANLPPSITSIGSECFASDKKLTITFDGCQSLKSIASDAFTNCNIIELKLCSSVSEIGSYSFSNNQHLEFADFSQTALKEIGSAAFAGCIRLGGIKLPSDLQGISPLVFVGCSELVDVDASRCANFEIHERLVYQKGLKVMVMCPGGLANASLASGIEALGPNSFYFCLKLERIDFPEECSISEIPAKTFFQCTRLGSITIPPSVAAVRDSAFFSCSSLARVEFMEGSLLSALDSNTFEGCVSLREIVFGRSNLTSIGDRTFFECRSLVSIRLPSSLKTLGAEAFAECSNLTSVAFLSPSGVVVLKSNTFANCTSLPEIALPDSLETLQRGVFSGCSSLSSITLAGDSLRVEEGALRGLSVRQINFAPSAHLDSVGSYAFAETRIASISLPGAQSIGVGVFEGCRDLGSLDLSAFAELGRIPPRSFYGCSSLSLDLRSLSVGSIGDEAFFGCIKLLSPAAPGIGRLSPSFNESVASIGKGAFRRSGVGRQIVLGPNVRSIGESAFADTGVQAVFYCGSEEVSVDGSLSPFNRGTIAFVSGQYPGRFCGLDTLRKIDPDCAMPTAAFTAAGGRNARVDVMIATLADSGDLRE